MKKTLSEKLIEKQKEIEDLESQLETSTQEFEIQRRHLDEQLAYMESTEDDIRDALVRSRVELREQLKSEQTRARAELKELQDERREEKMFECDVKHKELTWLLEVHIEEEELARVRAQIVELEMRREQWLRENEDRVIGEERELDERDEREDIRLAQAEQEEEEAALGDLQRQQFQIVQEKKTLIENYEELRLKILDRM